MKVYIMGTPAGAIAAASAEYVAYVGFLGRRWPVLAVNSIGAA